MSRPAFVIPHHSRTEQSWEFLGRALASVRAQNDPRWEAVIVDDGSPGSEKAGRFDRLRGQEPARLHVIQRSASGGPGHARNAGVEWAAARGAPFVLFLDADDLADPARLRTVRDCFERRPDVDFIYSTFEVVDEHDRPVPIERVTPSIREILKGHASHPVEGRDQWLRVALDTGYTTCTSTVAVSTALALAHPFPHTCVSEDSHTWLRMLAAGATVAFVDAALARRRICSSVRGSSTRQRFGDSFYWIKLCVDLDGFTRALDIARARGAITDEHAASIRRGFHARQAQTLAGERQDLAADMCRGLAALPAGDAVDRPLPRPVGI